MKKKAKSSSSSSSSSSESEEDDKKKRKCEYRKGKKHSKYSVQDKAKVIELIEKGTKTCDIVRMTGIPESTIRSIKKKKEEIKVCVSTAKNDIATKPAHGYDRILFR